MSKWDRRMLGLVNLIAAWSKDPSTGGGAGIVDAKNRVVSLGYNGFPRAVCDSDEALFDRDEKLRRTIHAEENALLFAGRPVEGCTLYMTHPPCARCAAKLIQAGIARVVAQMTAFNIVTGRDLTEAEGWLLLQILKDVRQWQRPGFHEDSADDCIAYAALKAEAKQREVACNGR